MVTKHQVALAAANYIKEYCDKTLCKECVFNRTGCIINQDRPYRWRVGE